MKIAINGYTGKKITGIGRTLIETLNYILNENIEHEIILYTNIDNEALIELYAENEKIKLIKNNISKNSSIKNLIFNAFIFPFKILREKPDVLYLPNIIPITIKPCKIVSVMHDLIEFRVQNKFSKIKTLYRYWVMPRIAKKSDKIITVSESSKNDIIQICKVENSKITVIYDAVNKDFNVISVDDNVPEDYLLYVGTVDYPGKNIHNAIKAFELAKKTMIDLKFKICGMPGKGYEEIYKIVDKSLYKKDIEILGYVNDEELKEYYSKAKIFIFISYYEGFGLPIIEAMKFGVPVITSDRSCLPEIAGDAAIICNPDDIEEIRDNILLILDSNEKRAELIRKGYENINRFSWKNTAKSTIKVIESV